jgi:hypothetical protein
MAICIGGAVGLSMIWPAPAKASLIASDNFQVGGTGEYTSGSIAQQSVTTGTSGYSTNSYPPNGNYGWEQGTSAYQATLVSLTTSSLVVSAPTSDAGSLWARGNGQSRFQNRAFASVPSSTTYYFSELLEASTPGNITGPAYVGLTADAASNASGSGTSLSFSGGVQLGYNSSGLAVYYYTGTGQTTATLLSSSANGLGFTLSSDTYLGYVSMNSSTDAITINLYDGTTEVATTTVTGSAASLTTTELGSYAGYVNTSFSAGSPSDVYFTDMRFGTAESDVINLSPVPDPASCALMVLAGLPLLGRRHRRLSPEAAEVE